MNSIASCRQLRTLAGTARTWQVTGVGPIPANAVAVTGNVTVTQQEAAGYLAVTPTATNTPPSSTINFPLADNRANNLAVPLSATGSLSAVMGQSERPSAFAEFDAAPVDTPPASAAAALPMAALEASVPEASS